MHLVEHVPCCAHKAPVVVKPPGTRIDLKGCRLGFEFVPQPGIGLPTACGNLRALAGYTAFRPGCTVRPRCLGSLPSRGEAVEYRVD